MKNMKYPVVGLIFVCVVLVGVGLKFVYDRTFVTSPIERDGEAIPGVLSVQVVEDTDGRADVIALLASDAMIEEVYPKLQQVTDSVLNRSSGRLIIADERNEHLVNVYYNIHFALHEGVSTGYFTRMIETIESELQPFNLYAKRIIVTDEHVFVTLREDEDDQAYLHAVIPRMHGR